MAAGIVFSCDENSPFESLLSVAYLFIIMFNLKINKEPQVSSFFQSFTSIGLTDQLTGGWAFHLKVKRLSLFDLCEN